MLFLRASYTTSWNAKKYANQRSARALLEIMEQLLRKIWDSKKLIAEQTWNCCLAVWWLLLKQTCLSSQRRKQ